MEQAGANNSKNTVWEDLPLFHGVIIATQPGPSHIHGLLCKTI